MGQIEIRRRSGNETTTRLISPTSPEPGEIIPPLLHQLRRVRTEIVGADDLVNQSLLALLTGEHHLIYGRPGTAKSEYARALLGIFGNAEKFSLHATKGTPEEAYVGPVDIKELTTNSRYVHQTDKTLVTADVAHLDEFFDANDAAIRAIMSILLERRFNKGRQQEESPLHTVLATTNYLRRTQMTEAVLDRFLFQGYMLPQNDPYMQLRIDQEYRAELALDRPEEQIPFDDIRYLTAIVEGQIPGQEISVPPHILFLKNGILTDYAEHMKRNGTNGSKGEYYLSPRTIAKANKVLNASALLHGRRTVTKADLDFLPYMVCEIGSPTEDVQRNTFDALKNAYLQISPSDLRIVDTLMATSDTLRALFDARAEGREIKQTTLNGLRQILGSGTPTIESITEQIQRINPDSQKVNALKVSLLAYISEQGFRLSAAGKHEPHILS